MRIALVDNGSLEAAAHAGLREAARAIGAGAGADVEAVSWKHSDRIPARELGGIPARTIATWVRAHADAGEREFLIIPFFISPQGAIGSSLRRDLGLLSEEAGGLEFSFTGGLADGAALACIVADRVRETIAAGDLRRPAVIVVDHGGPSPESAALRDRIASDVRAELGSSAGTLVAASMEAGGPHAEPLLSTALGSGDFQSGDVVIAPLFLLPGRHAGPGGDLRAAAGAAMGSHPGLRCHFAGLVGTHPAAVDTLSAALSRALGAPAHA